MTDSIRMTDMAAPRITRLVVTDVNDPTRTHTVQFVITDGTENGLEMLVGDLRITARTWLLPERGNRRGSRI